MKEVFKLIRSGSDRNPDDALQRLIPAGTPVSEMGWGSSLRSFASRYTSGRKVLGIREAKFLVVGLDYSGIIVTWFCCNNFHVLSFFIIGKTTILYKLKLGEIVTTIPTIVSINLQTHRIFLLLRLCWFSYIRALMWKLFCIRIWNTLYGQFATFMYQQLAEYYI